MTLPRRPFWRCFPRRFPKHSSAKSPFGDFTGHFRELANLEPDSDSFSAICGCFLIERVDSDKLLSSRKVIKNSSLPSFPANSRVFPFHPRLARDMSGFHQTCCCRISGSFPLGIWQLFCPKRRRGGARSLCGFRVQVSTCFWRFLRVVWRLFWTGIFARGR